MDAIIVLLGLFIGIAIYLALMNNVTAIVYSCSSVAFTFFICWGIGIVLAWIAWRIALIVGIVALIIYIFSKIMKSSKNATSKKAQTNTSTEQTEKAEN